MTRLIQTPIFFCFALLALLVTSCGSVEKLVESGHYEEAVRLAQNRLTGKQKKNPKFVLALETAFNKMIAQDMERARRMTVSGNPNWAEIASVYDNIQRRQDALTPLLPLVDKNGYQAEFRFARLDGLISEAEEKAAQQYYTEALNLLSEARIGNKSAGRKAFVAFGRVEEYRANYRDTDALRAEARELGKVFVAVQMVNETGGYLPRNFEHELLRPEGPVLDDNWRFYDFTPVAGKEYDYTARIVIDNIQVSPERVNERAYTDEKEITDGTEYVLDANGNVAKDTLGNDITRPRLVVVRADVLEVLQTKTALVSGSLELFDLRSQRVVDRDELTAEAVFENYASTFRGDRRALSRDTRRYLGNQPVQFPSDESLILEAADVLKPRLTERLERSSRVI
ncbi:hypothetical protein FUA23_09015 [Neolewinella aurantiaca]|uniref:Lipoprotein n=1 Tax=Neolewinella aurantiaca TaxID=2602767 RepID=A0A5C7FHA7_9BACT|nr:hypothetical protein [Neolewinella aurantiaca]TXF89816.1 hypothetical protein FUA23_09015 [Neolewinella aurantiaca]